jgi:hypothetical protein
MHRPFGSTETPRSWLEGAAGNRPQLQDGLPRVFECVELFIIDLLFVLHSTQLLLLEEPNQPTALRLVILMKFADLAWSVQNCFNFGESFQGGRVLGGCEEEVVGCRLCDGYMGIDGLGPYIVLNSKWEYFIKHNSQETGYK